MIFVDLFNVDHVTHFVPGVIDMKHLWQVDQSSQTRGFTCRYIEHDRLNLQTLLHTCRRCLKLCSGSIELIDKTDPRNIEAISLHPDSLTLRLDAHHTIEDGHRAIANSQ